MCQMRSVSPKQQGMASLFRLKCLRLFLSSEPAGAVEVELPTSCWCSNSCFSRICPSRSPVESHRKLLRKFHRVTITRSMCSLGRSQECASGVLNDHARGKKRAREADVTQPKTMQGAHAQQVQTAGPGEFVSDFCVLIQGAGSRVSFCAQSNLRQISEEAMK